MTTKPHRTTNKTEANLVFLCKSSVSFVKSRNSRRGILRYLIYLTTVDQCRASSKNKPTWTNCRQRKTNVHYQQGAVKSRFPSPEFLIVKAVIFESKQALPLCLSIFLARKFGRQGRLKRFIFATIYCPLLQPFLTTSWGAAIQQMNHYNRGCQKVARLIPRKITRNHPNSMWYSFLSIECHMTSCFGSHLGIFLGPKTNQGFNQVAWTFCFA
mgnify:CR=1 FL=1